MALYDYSKVKHPGGYTGIRVTGTLKGEQIQKYFKQSPENMARAMALHEEIIEDSKHRGAGIGKRYSQQYNFTNPRYDPPRRTKIVGLTMSFQEQKKCTPIIYYPAIIIAHTDKSRDLSKITARCITQRRDLLHTWQEACQILSDWRDYDEVPAGWLASCPTRADYLKLRRHYNKHAKKNIALSCLDVV